MPWRDSIAPASPGSLTAVKYRSDSVVLKWVKPAAASELDKAWQFVIYRSQNPVIDTSLAENILAITTNDTTAYTDNTGAPDTTYYYTVTTTDRFHNESSASNTVSNLPPVINCPGDTMLVLNGSCAVTLPDFSQQTTVQASSPVTITQIPAAGSLINGQHDTPVTLIATDDGGNADTCQFLVKTVDREAPVITNVSADPAQLWPPNHKMRDVTINYSATDNCGGVTNSLSVTSNEPVTGNGDGNTSPDWIVTDDHHVQLRAERSGFGNGRIYTIAITSTDSAGNTGTQTVTVTVPCFPGDVDGILTLKAFPNPAPNQFIIMTLSTSPKPLAITVVDNMGKVIEARSGLPSTGLFYLGSNYAPGIYYLEVKQGSKTETIKLIKSGH